MKTTAITLLSFALFLGLMISCNDSSTKDSSLVAFTTVEDSIRQQLNIPTNAKRVLILSPAAHMDWDWLNPFPYNVNLEPPSYDPNYFYGGGYKNAPANHLLTKATQNLDTAGYYYSVCEMGFLRAFARDSAAYFKQMVASNRLRIVGGGITSPDNLLPNGETFFRNFLVANQWLDSVQVPWSQQVWVPDDFGHDPQLPVMLNAMDAMGVGFARIPGACNGHTQPYTQPKDQLLDTVNGGVDFIWKAQDGSSVIAHWLESHYNQGADIETPYGQDYSSPQDVINCSKPSSPATPAGHIANYLGANGPVSPTPYIYVHVSNDFMYPNQNLVADANDWNTSATYGYSQTGVYAVVATFDEYMRLVNSYQGSLKTRSYNPNVTAVDSFAPNPYWMGFYASRPELKILHNKATRGLLGAETYQVMANTLLNTGASEKQQQMAALYATWNNLAPSTHHDYITGTANDGVYQNEQLPLLTQTQQQADSLRTAFISQITNQLPAASGQVAVFNQLGMPAQGIIPYQSSYINVKAPSLGYQVSDLATASQGDGSLQYQKLTNGNHQFENSLLTAVFDGNNGNLISVVDKTTNTNILSGTANDLAFFIDEGDIYRFGYEGTCTDFAEDTSVNSSTSSITVDTSNALHKSITITRNYNVNSNSYPYTFTYSLQQGEPMLRITTKGAAPVGYTVMVKFPLAASITSMDVGTPYHWNTVYPMPYGNSSPFNSTMWATHDFVIPKGSSGALASIYHAATPAWTSNGNTLYGVMLRNNPSPGYCIGGYGADGGDNNVHQQNYAFRVPSGLGSPSSGAPLKEARLYNTPMQAMAVPATGGGSLPSSYSLGTVSGNSLITCAKWASVNSNDLILRVYQGSNTSAKESITLGKSFNTCSTVSALEKPFTNSTNVPSCAASSPNSISVSIPTAVATVRVTY